MLRSSEGQFELFTGFQRQRRLVVILDGMDEASGELKRRLDDEIHSIYVHKFHLVLTSRFIANQYEGEKWRRFRRLRVKELQEDQQAQVLQLRLPGQEEMQRRFLGQIQSNPALSDLGTNPLMLNLIISVLLERPNEDDLDRGKIFDIVITSMISHLEGVKTQKKKSENRAQEADLRTVLRTIAWEIMSAEAGNRRDFPSSFAEDVVEGLNFGFNGGKRGAVEQLRIAYRSHVRNELNWRENYGRFVSTSEGNRRRAAAEAEVERRVRSELQRRGSGTGIVRFTTQDWIQCADGKVKTGRFPMLAWVQDEGQDMFRFAHLTFQEFLCAEFICKRLESSAESLENELASTLNGGVFERTFTEPSTCFWFSSKHGANLRRPC